MPYEKTSVADRGRRQPARLVAATSVASRADRLFPRKWRQPLGVGAHPRRHPSAGLRGAGVRLSRIRRQHRPPERTRAVQGCRRRGRVGVARRRRRRAGGVLGTLARHHHGGICGDAATAGRPDSGGRISRHAGPAAPVAAAGDPQPVLVVPVSDRRMARRRARPGPGPARRRRPRDPVRRGPRAVRQDRGAEAVRRDTGGDHNDAAPPDPKAYWAAVNAFVASLAKHTAITTSRTPRTSQNSRSRRRHSVLRFQRVLRCTVVSCCRRRAARRGRRGSIPLRARRGRRAARRR